MSKKPTYKDLNGTTRVGDFLRSLTKGELLQKVLGAGLEVMTGDVGGAIKTILTRSDELSEEQKEYALALLELDLKENEEVTKRWESDNQQDGFLARNVRPLTLIFLSFMMTVFVICDSSIDTFIVDTAWIDLLKSLLITVYFAYFGGRSVEKFRRIQNQ